VQAGGQLQRAIELDPDYARARALLGHVYLTPRYAPSSELDEKELAERARDLAKTALKIAPGMPAALAVLGDVTDDVDAKGELYREAVANGPNEALALQAYVRYLVQNEFQTDDAIELSKRLIQLDPLDEKHHWLLAHLQVLQAQMPLALETIAKGKEKVPDSIELRDLEAFAYFEIGEYAAAIVAKYETLAIDPNEFINRWSIATLYLLVNMPDEAELWFERATETTPEKWRSNMQLTHRTMLNVYRQRNDEEVFEAFKQWRGFSFGLEQRGIFELFIEYGVRLGRLEEVVALYEKSLPNLFTDPPTQPLKNPLALYGTALALLRDGDKEKAEPLVRAMLEFIDSSKEGGFYTSPMVANLLLAQGETDAALESFRQYVANNKFYISGNGAQFLYRHSSLYDPIRNEPEFIELLEEWEVNAAEHREKLQAMDLPVM
jgi:tetratricopeptide (TPR) repeat protein